MFLCKSIYYIGLYTAGNIGFNTYYTYIHIFLLAVSTSPKTTLLVRFWRNKAFERMQPHTKNIQQHAAQTNSANTMGETNRQR